MSAREQVTERMLKACEISAPLLTAAYREVLNLITQYKGACDLFKARIAELEGQVEEADRYAQGLQDRLTALTGQK